MCTIVPNRQRGTKKLEWDGLVKFLVRCSRKLDSRAPAEVIATARRLRDGRTYPVLLTARDIQSLREKHNAHLLDEIVAIQPFVLKNPFTECGLFETDFERKGVKRTSAATLATYELVRWPEEEVKWFGGVGSSGADSLTRPSGRAGEICAQQRRRKGSAKRVHGVVHRLLATTTKQIVEHVEREVRSGLTPLSKCVLVFSSDVRPEQTNGWTMAECVGTILVGGSFHGQFFSHWLRSCDPGCLCTNPNLAAALDF